MTDWTREQIEERLHEAADVMKRLPAIKVQGYYNLWPGIVREFADLVGQEPQRLRRPPPAPAAISRMEETLGWLVWLEPDALGSDGEVDEGAGFASVAVLDVPGSAGITAIGVAVRPELEPEPEVVQFDTVAGRTYVLTARN